MQRPHHRCSIDVRGVPEPNRPGRVGTTPGAQPGRLGVRRLGPISPDLSQAGLFRGLPRVSLARLLMLSRPGTFPSGSLLLRANRSNGYLFVVAAGRVRVEWLSPQLPRSAVLGELGPGDCLGGFGILDGYRPALTAVALEDTSAWLLPFNAIVLTMLHDAETRVILGHRLDERRRAFDAQVDTILREAAAADGHTPLSL
jgi:CRP-like cAMP-binding protein